MDEIRKIKHKHWRHWFMPWQKLILPNDFIHTWPFSFRQSSLATYVTCLTSAFVQIMISERIRTKWWPRFLPNSIRIFFFQELIIAIVLKVDMSFWQQNYNYIWCAAQCFKPWNNVARKIASFLFIYLFRSVWLEKLKCELMLKWTVWTQNENTSQF